MREGVVVDETIEVRFHLAGDFARAPGARALPQPRRAVTGQALAPLAQGGIGKRERVGDGGQALACDDRAHGWGTAEDAGFPGLLDAGISGRERVIVTVQFEGPHRGVSSNKILQKLPILRHTMC